MTRNGRQLVSSLGFTAGGTPIAAEQLGYGYDPGWNMTNRTVNGPATTYSVNDLNEVTSDGAGSYSYDQNGNRTGKYGGYNYTYDDENRLTLVSDDSGHTFRTGFIYDGLGRLRARQVYMWYTQYSIWIPTDQWRYLYDGSRVVQERTYDQPLVAYTRGNDLSGSLEGAGGIGGLLARSEAYYGGNWHGHAFYHADGNGNVTSLVGTNLAVVASYKYDPYGRTLSSSGSLASANVYRFSSKEIHPESGMYYYLYRFYDPNVQRWLNRDPLGAEAPHPASEWHLTVPIEIALGANPFRPFENDPISHDDPDGRLPVLVPVIIGIGLVVSGCSKKPADVDNCWATHPVPWFLRGGPRQIACDEAYSRCMECCGDKHPLHGDPEHPGGGEDQTAYAACMVSCTANYQGCGGTGHRGRGGKE